MSIECAFYGFLTADAEPRVSGAGKSWVRLRAGIGRDDAVQWVQIAVFGAAAERAATLKKSDRIYVEGSLTTRPWQASDGTLHAGLNVAAFKCERTHDIGRNKSSLRKEKETDGQAPARTAAAVQGGSQFNDEISVLGNCLRRMDPLAAAFPIAARRRTTCRDPTCTHAQR